MSVSDEDLRALREHFASAGPSGGGVTRATRAPGRIAAGLRVARLELPFRGDGTVVTVDGAGSSGHGSDAYDGLPVSGCAAVALDGRALLGWFATPDIGPDSIYAEWQAARLGMRLAARYPAATIATDNNVVADQLRKAIAGERLAARALGGVDAEAAGEIAGLARGREITVAWRYESGAPQNRTGATVAARSAHAGAWLMRRFGADGLDPAEHVAWITEKVASPPGDKSDLRRSYLGYLKRIAGA